MSHLSPTLKVRLKAHLERTKNLKNKNDEIEGQNKTIIDLKQITEKALQQDLSKEGLDLCSISKVNNTDLLLVNTKKFNDLHSKELDLNFKDLHTICLLEKENMSDANEPLTKFYSTQIFVQKDYCALLGQVVACKVDVVHE